MVGFGTRANVVTARATAQTAFSDFITLLKKVRFGAPRTRKRGVLCKEDTGRGDRVSIPLKSLISGN
jgi:hypothetical protein